MSIEKRILSDAREIKNAAELNHGHEAVYSDSALFKQPWPAFDSGADKYFNEHRGFDQVMSLEDAQDVINAMHEKFDNVLGVDIMGQGRAVLDIGCDHAVGTTLPLPDNFQDKEEWLEELEGDTDLVQGDIFDKRVMQEVLSKVDEYCKDEKSTLGSVTYRPIGGGVVYQGNSFAEEYLFQRVLLPLYERLGPEGFMLIDLDQVENRIPLALMDRLEDEFGSDISAHTKWSQDYRRLRLSKPG